MNETGKSSSYIISIDQSTQGTKALLFDESGNLLMREDKPHRQIVNELGWVSHDPEEIYRNTVEVIKSLVERSGVEKEKIAGIGISNQRETSLIWNRDGSPAADAVVWQCARAEEICRRIEAGEIPAAGREGSGVPAEIIRQRTGLPLSPYFPAAKLAWLLEHTGGAAEKAAAHELCMGTIDTYLIYRLTHGKSYKTDYSNASRTQLFNIFDLRWDREICTMFGICPDDLAEVCDSDSLFGETDAEGYFPCPVPIHGVLGDSHGALLGQGCLKEGMAKCTYGTGSSIMMNVGEKPVVSTHGVVTSLAWGMGGKVNYVLEGNINYTGAVISWLKDDVKLIESAGETEQLCRMAVQDDSLYLVPAFTGLGAPYWDSSARAALTGITRTTGKAEIVRAGIECIAYQITDVVKAMGEDAGVSPAELRVDGGPTRNGYLMQFQSDILDTDVLVPDAEELSGIGAAYAAGMGLGLYGDEIFSRIQRKIFSPQMRKEDRMKRYAGWKEALGTVLTHGKKITY